MCSFTNIWNRRNWSKANRKRDQRGRLIRLKGISSPRSRWWELRRTRVLGGISSRFKQGRRNCALGCSTAPASGVGLLIEDSSEDPPGSSILKRTSFADRCPSTKMGRLCAGRTVCAAAVGCGLGFGELACRPWEVGRGVWILLVWGLGIAGSSGNFRVQKGS